MHFSVKNTALILLVSLGIVACGSGGGGSSAPVGNTNTENNARIQALEAQVQSQQQALKKAEESANQAKADLATAQNNVETAKQQLQTEQAKTLAETQAKQTAEQALNKAKADLVTAQNNVETAKQQLQTEQAKTLAETQAKQTAEQALTKAKADLATAQNNLNQTQKALNYWDSSWRYFGNGEENAKRATIGRTANGITIDLSKTPISDEVVTLDVLKDGEKVGVDYYINQAYSSYSAFIPTNIDMNAPFYSHNDFVFIPTSTNADFITQGGSATYTGKVIDRNYNNDEDMSGYVTKADLKLDVDFGANTVEGVINNRENGRKDILLEKTNITSPVNNGYVNMPQLGFSGVASTTRANGSKRTGNYIGFFAGANAEEVVGSVSGVGGQSSFGGKR